MLAELYTLMETEKVRTSDSFFVLVILLLPFVSETAFSHSGGTNAEGCHTNRRTGDYHCHSPKPRALDSVSYCHLVEPLRIRAQHVC